MRLIFNFVLFVICVLSILLSIIAFTIGDIFPGIILAGLIAFPSGRLFIKRTKKAGEDRKYKKIEKEQERIREEQDQIRNEIKRLDKIVGPILREQVLNNVLSEEMAVEKKYGKLLAAQYLKGDFGLQQLKERHYSDLYGPDITLKILTNNIFIGMPEEILYERLGKPDDKKESVSRGKTEIRLYYGRYLTKRKNIKYRKEYKIVNGQLDSWKDL